MSSFFAESIIFIAHRRATVCAFLSFSRQLFNSSIIPVALNMDETWRLLQEGDKRANFQQKILSLFRHSDTLQFAPSLTLSSCLTKSFADELFASLLGKQYFCRTLKRLSLQLVFSSLHDVLAKVVSLESFELLDVNDIVTDHLRSIAQASGLRHLKITNARQVERVNLLYMCERLPRLQSLVMHSAIQVKDDGWIPALSKLPLLEVLDINLMIQTGVSDNFMKSLFPQKLKKLREFDVRKMPFMCLGLKRVEMTDEGVAALTGLENLQKLDLSASPITDKSLKVLAESHLTLTHLVLDTCTRITCFGGLELLRTMPALKLLSLQRLNGILNDEWLQVIGTFSGLEVLKLGENEGVTDKGLELLCCCVSVSAVENEASDSSSSLLSPLASSLREIVLSDRKIITSKGLTALSKMPLLEVFVFINFSSLDDKGVWCFPHFPSLKSLIISGSRNVTPGAFVEALPKCRKLKRIFLDNFANMKASDYQLLEKALRPILYAKADQQYRTFSSTY